MAFQIAGGSAFTALFLLPVDAAEVDGGQAVHTLYGEALVADADVQPISLIRPILHGGPLLPPEVDIRPLVVLTILPLAEAGFGNRTGRNDDVDVRVVPCMICWVPTCVNRSNRAQIAGNKILVDECRDNLPQLIQRQFVWQRALELPGCPSIPAHLSCLDRIAQSLQMLEV